MRHAVHAIAAINQTTVPWCSILVRNVFGVGGGGHQPAGRLSLRYAWPSGRWGSLPLEGGIEAAYRAELAAAEEPATKDLATILPRQYLQSNDFSCLDGRGSKPAVARNCVDRYLYERSRVRRLPTAFSARFPYALINFS
jgi:acetyl-CoA carboxylase carboxyltransferase component